MGLSSRRVEQLATLQTSFGTADREGDSTFQALDRDFPLGLMARNILSCEDHQANDFHRLGLYQGGCPGFRQCRAVPLREGFPS